MKMQILVSAFFLFKKEVNKLYNTLNSFILKSILLNLLSLKIK